MRRSTTTTAPAVTEPPRPREHLIDPDLGAVLFATWSGDPAIVVASPPGAGKTRLITHLAAQLHSRAGLRVCIAAQTRAQTADICGRLAMLDQPVHHLGAATGTRPAGLHPKVNHVAGAPRLRTTNGIVVATTARWLWTETDLHGADVVLIDEAYQMTYADLSAVGSLAPQIVLVGDPGQIDPVVTGATHRWAGQQSGPQVPAPTALLAAHGSAIARHDLTRSWRCGPVTTALLQPAFYPDLPFTSARAPIEVIDANGRALPELSTLTITPNSEMDPQIAATAAATVRELLTGIVKTETGSRPMRADDIAVVTPHVNQASLTAAHLADHPDVLIGTANAVQGSERTAVVVVHPLCGQAEVNAFNTDLGRLCVALSRHRAHARVITDARTPALLQAAVRDDPDHAVLTQHSLLSAMSALADQGGS